MPYDSDDEEDFFAEAQRLVQKPTSGGSGLDAFEVVSAGVVPTDGGFKRRNDWVNFKLQLRVIVVRLYYSRLTAVLYGSTFLLAAVLLAQALGFDTPLGGEPRLRFLLETLITMSLLVEVALRAVVLGREYLDSWYNIFDGTIALASGFFLFWASPLSSPKSELKNAFSEEKQEDLELSQSLVMVRIIVQFARVLLIVEHTQRLRRERDGGGDVPDFDEIDLDFGVLQEKVLQSRRRGEDDGL